MFDIVTALTIKKNKIKTTFLYVKPEGMKKGTLMMYINKDFKNAFPKAEDVLADIEHLYPTELTKKLDEIEKSNDGFWKYFDADEYIQYIGKPWRAIRIQDTMMNKIRQRFGP